MASRRSWIDCVRSPTNAPLSDTPAAAFDTRSPSLTDRLPDALSTVSASGLGSAQTTVTDLVADSFSFCEKTMRCFTSIATEPFARSMSRLYVVRYAQPVHVDATSRRPMSRIVFISTPRMAILDGGCSQLYPVQTFMHPHYGGHDTCARSLRLHRINGRWACRRRERLTDRAIDHELHDHVVRGEANEIKR
jgi:hypothetical protein